MKCKACKRPIDERDGYARLEEKEIVCIPCFTEVVELAESSGLLESSER